MAPFISDVESFHLLDGSGVLHRCARNKNEELFRLAIGGYGLFGVITRVCLRLSPRKKLRRKVELIDVDTPLRAPKKLTTRS